VVDSSLGLAMARIRTASGFSHTWLAGDPNGQGQLATFPGPYSLTPGQVNPLQSMPEPTSAAGLLMGLILICQSRRHARHAASGLI
jgi:hypothetical protein